MEIRRVQYRNGENYSVLLGDNSFPMAYPNLYVTIHHRNNSDASNTCHIVLEQIRYLYEIFDFMKIDVVRRCMQGEFLTKPELETLVKWSKRKVDSFREHVEVCKAQNVTSLEPRRKKLESARAVIIVDDENDISPITSYNRITTYARYISWLETYLMPSKSSSTERRLKAMRPKKRRANTEVEMLEFDDNYKSLTREQVIELLRMVSPNSTENPWVSEGVRYRNQLIFNLLEAVGCRRGELAKMRIDDFRRSPKNGRWYVIIRSDVDYEDKRINRPEAKTLGRRVPLDKRMVEMVNHYIEVYRSQVKGVEHCPYLFVTHNHKVSQNQAISLSAITKVFRQISKVAKFRVHPHALRHSWNDRFSERADMLIKQGKVSEAKSESDRQKLMGWSEGSKMAKQYSERHNSKRAFEFGLELQEKSSEEIEAIVGDKNKTLR